MSSHHHRSTLSQSNKPFKGSGGASKRTLKNKAKGKIESVSDSHQKPAAGGPRTGIKSTVMSAQEARKNRTNAAKLAVKAKRDDHAAVQRFYCGRNAPAKVVAVIPLCTDYDPHATFAALYAAMDAEYAPSDAPSIVMPTRFKQQRLQFLKPARELLAVLDAVKLADYCLFVLSAKVEVDPFGEVLLTSILSQGLPSTVSVVQHLEAVAPTLKRQSEIRKSLLSYMSFWSPATEKVFTLGSSAECTNIVRTITDRNPKHVSWRDQYPYMIPDAVVPSPAVSGEEDKVDLAVTGHIRGNRFTANRLVHIPGFGDFQVSSVVSASLSAADQGMDTSGELLDTPDEDADDLVALNEMDDLMNEQTWPTEQELALGAARAAKVTKRVPKGTSAYQAAWIVESDSEEEEEEVEQVVPAITSGGHFSAPHLTRDFEMTDDFDWSHVTGRTPSSSLTAAGDATAVGHHRSHAHPSGHDDADAMSISGESASDKSAEEEAEKEEYEYVEMDDRASVWDTKMDAVEQRKQLEAYLDQRKRQLAEEADDDREFPDEVETPLTVPAKVRFARYRGLKSSRKSPWDPKENLPREYSQLFHFESWRRTRARVVKEHQLAPVAAGQYVTVHIRNVPALAMSHFFMPAVLGDVPVGDGASTALFWLVGLLPYEHKVTTVQFTAQRRDEYTAPIRSKDAAVLQIGWRRVEAAPVWSEHARDGGNKVFKFERFLQPKRVAMGTVFAPNTFFGPVLMLQPGTAAAGEHRSDPALVAVGLVAGADADRVMAKRVVLTGHPYKVHRKIAVIRWMFYAPDDIMWFKPVQLYTKYGRTGHIRESMGTHGYMKCIFDGPVQQHDTICMNLYKRVFPKRFGETYFSSGRDAGERWDSVVVGGKDGEDEDEEDEDAMDM